MCIMKYHLSFHYMMVTYTPTSKRKAMLLCKDDAHWMKKCQKKLQWSFKDWLLEKVLSIDV